MGTLDGQGHVIKNLTITGERDTAGLIGYIARPYASTAESSLKNLGLEDVNININGGTDVNVGALLVDNQRGHVTVSNCYVTGSISASGSTVYAGGLVGLSTGYNPGGRLTMRDCYSTATINVTATTFNGDLGGPAIIVAGKAYAGGVVSRAHDADIITNCHNSGAVTATSTGLSIAGGISAMQANSAISNCSNTAAVSATSSYATDDYYASETKYISAGGILAFSTTDSTLTDIARCYNTGNITAKLTTTKDKTEIFAGGIGSRTNKQNLSDCYNTGAVSAGNGNNTAGHAGGIAGRSSAQSNVRRCYNTGTVSGANPGGVVGLALPGSYTRASYWLSSAAPAGVAEGDGETTGLSAEAMKLETSYPALNFIQTWGFKAGENGDLPVLRFFYPGLEYTPNTPPAPSRDFLAAIEPPVDGAYPITSVADLQKIGAATNGLPLNWDYVLTTNLDLNGIDWQPIGSATAPFLGSFDGQGYAIHNLAVEGQRDHAGLFGYLGGSTYGTTATPTIKNLGLENVTINVTGTSSASATSAGGLVGENYRTAATISNCYVTGTITAAARTPRVGGIIGYTETYTGGSLVISDCYNAATVTATASYNTGYTSAGGIIGSATEAKTILNCHNAGTITATANYYCAAGGIAATLTSGNKILTQCSNTGRVSATTTDGSQYLGAGGIVGYNSSSDEMSTITSCWNSGEISAFLDTTYTSNEVYAGGIGGRTHNKAVSDCYNTGNISATSRTHLAGAAGGILGRSSAQSSVRRCYSTGDVAASQSPGAIIGLALDGSFAWACYWNREAAQTRDTQPVAQQDKKGVGSGTDTTTPLPAADLKQEASLARHFSFAQTWGFASGDNNGYPVLRAFYAGLVYTPTTAAPVPERDFIVPASQIDPPAQGSIPIGTREELETIRDNLTGKYHLTADIDMSGVDWDPIGEFYTDYNDSKAFQGVLDGQGHVITGLTTLGYYGRIHGWNDYGGLFGLVAGNAVIKNLGLEDVCIYNTGWTSWTGGLCGGIGGSAQIGNCYVTGQISGGGDGTQSASVGGVAGVVVYWAKAPEIIDCYSRADITAVSEDALHAGGFCGLIYHGRLYNCLSTGDVTASRHASAGGSYPFVGGVTGYVNNKAEVAQCTNTGKVTLIAGSYQACAGGVTGYVAAAAQVNASANTGDVRLTSTHGSSSPTLEAGGIAGRNRGKLADSYNRAGVTTEKAAGAADTNIFVGGVVGNNFASGAEAVRCYSTGSISGSNPGGLAGNVAEGAAVTSCYWNKDSDQYVNGNLMPAATRKGIFLPASTAAGLTTAQMKQQASFSGFDFTTVWNMASGQNDGYPVLRVRPTPYTVTTSGTYSSTTGGGSYTKGQTVNITAPATPNTSYRFKEWTTTSGGVTFANKNSASTSFIMPAAHVAVVATYELIPTYTVKIKGNTYGNSYRVGATVTITASNQTGKQFKQWVADRTDIVLADKTSRTTTFVMPERHVEVEAVYDNINYTVTVNSGTASSGTAIMGATITLTAGTPEAGKQFSRWSSATSGVSFADRYAEQTTFTMPARDVTITAEYTTATKGSQSAPAAPTLAGKTSSSVTLNPISGAEYRRGSGAWQDSPVFTGLSANTNYYFYARMKATDLLNASSSSASLAVRTSVAGADPDPGTPDPNKPETEKAADDKAALTHDAIKGANPDASNVTSNLSLPATGSNGSSITWTSSHPNVVDATGVVTPPPAGQPDVQVTLTATITNGGATETVSITLTVKAQGPAITGVKLAQSSIRLAKGQTATIGAVVYYSDGSTGKALTWKSSNEKVATVKNGKITAKSVKKNSTATITATAENGQSTKVKVTVLKSSAKAVKPTKVTISGAKKTLKVGKTAQLKVKVSPSTATGAAVTWKSSKTSVLRVDATGKITAQKKGTAKITVKAGGASATVTVKVT
ncbi:MAG: hypothetical protein GXY32_08545 [Ruminococcaceae bacterium]|nr:hypothetical protein [Oscillospiraceae bacterium]